MLSGQALSSLRGQRKSIAKRMDAMLGYLRGLLLFLVTLVPLCLGVSVLGLVEPARGANAAMWLCRFWLRLFRIQVKLIDHNPAPTSYSNCLFVLLNQTSLLDGTVGAVMMPPPMRYVINLEYALLPFVGWTTAVFSTVLVRQWPSQARRALARICEFLQSGGNVYISIEGRVSREGTLSPYKKGPVVLAISAQSRIVPVVIRGTRECMSPGSAFIRSGTVTVEFLTIVDVRGVPYEDRDLIVERLRRIAVDHVQQQEAEKVQ